MTTPAPKTPPSPTPWRAVRENEYVTTIEDANGREIGSFSGGWEDAPDEHARISVNAHAAVLAVNEYEGLRDFVREFLDWGAKHEVATKGASSFGALERKASALLARIEEQTR